MTAAVVKKGRGGARPGAGRKPKDKPNPVEVGKALSAVEIHAYTESHGVEPPPFMIGVEACEVWATCAPEVLGRSDTKPSDKILLAAYCIAAGEVAGALGIIETEGMVEKRPNGQMLKHPAAAMMSEHLTTMAKLSDELGLTPLARARLQKAQAEAYSKAIVVERQKKHDRDAAAREREAKKKPKPAHAGIEEANLKARGFGRA